MGSNSKLSSIIAELHESSQSDVETVARVLEIAMLYARACDEQKYPSIQPHVEELKSAARIMRWQLENILAPPQLRQKHERRVGVDKRK